MIPSIRSPAVAGFFYPAPADELRRDVRGYLSGATAQRRMPAALIAPHAGYRYSGPIAGSAYAGLAELAGAVRRVVLVGPSHRVSFRGLAVPESQLFRTPLGDVPIDSEAVAALCELPYVSVLEAAHADEHSLEVHLPFLQEVLEEGFRIVPIVVGDARADETAAALERVWDDDSTLVVASSDLSHYHDAETAKRLDRLTAHKIEALGPVDSEGACGSGPINGLLVAARRRGLVARTLDLRSSADTAGTPDRVVGYGAFAFLRAATNTATSGLPGTRAP